MTSEGPLRDAAASAPTGAGVYFFLDDGRRLLYVGKAVNLRRRLQQHAKEVPVGGRSKYARVRYVAWEELADDDAACHREADLIACLRPAQNAAITRDARWTYLCVANEPEGPSRFSLVRTAPGAGVDVYGCFPHLGKGQTSRPGIACSDGYTALLRLLWATGASGSRGAGYPRSISGTAPPMEATIDVARARRPVLHRFLSGTSPRLLDDLASGVAEVEPYLRTALTRDLAMARGFFDHGPAALRRLRLGHGLPPGPVARETIESLVRAEVTAVIGEVARGGGYERGRRRRLLP